jgi:hypothetical protein
VPIELIRRSFSSPPEISVILYQIISPSGWEIPELVVTSSAFSPYWEFRLKVSFLDEPAGPLFLFYLKKEEESLYWYLVALPFAFFSCWCSYTLLKRASLSSWEIYIYAPPAAKRSYWINMLICFSSFFLPSFYRGARPCPFLGILSISRVYYIFSYSTLCCYVIWPSTFISSHNSIRISSMDFLLLFCIFRIETRVSI